MVQIQAKGGYYHVYKLMLIILKYDSPKDFLNQVKGFKRKIHASRRSVLDENRCTLNGNTNMHRIHSRYEDTNSKNTPCMHPNKYSKAIITLKICRYLYSPIPP